MTTRECEEELVRRQQLMSSAIGRLVEASKRMSSILQAKAGIDPYWEAQFHDAIRDYDLAVRIFCGEKA